MHLKLLIAINFHYLKNIIKLNNDNCKFNIIIFIVRIIFCYKYKD